MHKRQVNIKTKQVDKTKVKRIPKLDSRLNAILHMTQGAQSIVDVGCDHGKLSLHLAKRGLKVIAADISSQSLQKAKKLSIKHNTLIDTREGFGLDVIGQNEVQAIIIAGMGQKTIISIIQKSKDIASSTKYLILQSMNGDYDLRRYLSKNDFLIVDEMLIIEGHRLYCVIKVQPNKKSEISEVERYLGPVLLKNRPENFERYLKYYIEIIIDIIKGLNEAKNMNLRKMDYYRNILSKMENIKNA